VPATTDEDIRRATCDAMLALEDEWDSKKCPVCGTAKWEHYPFCRSCSIRLQSANMMYPLTAYRGCTASEICCGWFIGFKEEKHQVRDDDKGVHLVRWFCLYDMSRDYLSCIRRGLGHGPVGRKKQRDLDEEAPWAA
jgi:hypothetical protein